MARQVGKRDIGPVLAAARTWINDCLVGEGSVFSSGVLWKPELVDQAIQAFVDHPDTSDDAFMVKLARQMSEYSPGAKQLVAEILWAIFLFPSNMKASTK